MAQMRTPAASAFGPWPDRRAVADQSAGGGGPGRIAAPPLSAPLTGNRNGALAGSDQVEPSVSGGNRP
jgi:hypothetical protein